MITIKLQSILLMSIIFILLATAVSAAVEIKEDKLFLDVDYNHLETENQKQIDFTGGITITNSGAESITVNIVFSGLPSGYTADAINSVALTAGETKTVSYLIKVPHKEDPGERTIGTVEVKDSASSTVLASKPIVQKTKSMLSLKELQVKYVNDKDNTLEEEFSSSEEKIDLDDGVKAGSEFKLSLIIENLFDRDYDNDYSTLDDITLEIKPEEKDLIKGNFNESYDLDSLDARDKITQDLNFVISEDIDAGEYTLEITLTAQDGKEVDYEVTRELTIKVERTNDDVRIIKAEVNPTTVSCENKILIPITIKNFGTSDQVFTGVTLYNQKLKIQETTPFFKLPRYKKSESIWTNTFVYSLPANLAQGTYPIDVTVAIDKGTKIDQKVVSVVVGACKAPVVEETKAGENTLPPPVVKAAEKDASDKTAVKDSTATKKDTTTSTTSTVVKSVEDPYTNDDIAVGLLVVGIVIVLSFITWFMVILFKK